MNIPEELVRARDSVAAVFTEAHAANDAAGQSNENLRQLVAQTSAALTALDRAVRHAETAYPTGGSTS